LTEQVVLPTPPFWSATEMTRLMSRAMFRPSAAAVLRQNSRSRDVVVPTSSYFGSVRAKDATIGHAEQA